MLLEAPGRLSERFRFWDHSVCSLPPRFGATKTARYVYKRIDVFQKSCNAVALQFDMRSSSAFYRLTFAMEQRYMCSGYPFLCNTYAMTTPFQRTYWTWRSKNCTPTNLQQCLQLYQHLALCGAMAYTGKTVVTQFWMIRCHLVCVLRCPCQLGHLVGNVT